MVWKTNFDQIPYQELLESRQQKSISTSSNSSSSSTSQSYSNNSKSSSSNFNVNNNHVNNNNVIHARPNSAINTMTQRDGSPITIPLNESVAHADEEETQQQMHTRHSLDPTANAIASATSAPRSNSGSNLHQSRPNTKKLAFSNGNGNCNNNNNNNNNSNSSNGTVTPGSGSLLKKLTSNNNEIDKNSMPNISNTLEHIVQQLDILTQVKCYFNIKSLNIFHFFSLK